MISTNLLLLIICSLLSFAVGAIFDATRSASGTLKIDCSNPEKDIYRLEIDNLDVLPKKRRIILRIDHDADLSQK